MHLKHSFRTVVLCLAGGLCLQQTGGAAADVVLRAADAAISGSAWSVVADATAAGGSRVANPDRRAAKLTTAAASPASFFELTFEASAGTPYRLWIRGTAQGNSYENDSAFVQFSDSVTAAGAPTWRIGTTSSTTYVLENGSGAGLSGWGWQDNGYGTAGPLVYFAASGSHRIRVQSREDGLSIDQIVLSPATYLTDAPGATRNDTTLLTGGGTSPAIALVREPYLHQVTDRSVILVWASREPGPATAIVGGHTVTAASIFHPQSATGIGYDYYQHHALITGLAAATTYGYDVFVGGVRATPGTDVLRTAPAPGSGSVSFAIIGDSGTGSTEQQALAALMRADSLDVVLHSGDLAYGNSGGTGDASHTTVQRWFFDIYRDLLRRRPIFPVTGNHDARASNNWGRAYLDAFVLPEDAGAGAYPDHAERYYSFDYGPVHFVALDTELAFSTDARRAAQLAWLEADLAATSQPWKVAFFHKAPYSSLGEHGSNLDVRQAFAPVFERHGVQLALSSHEHDYERLVPWRESSDPSRQAVINIVSGGGGAPVYPAGQAEWTAISRSVHHYLKVTIAGCVAEFRAIDTAGRVLDAYSFDRCEQETDTSAPAVAFSEPSAGAAVSGPVTIAGVASDDTRVEKVDLWIDGVLRGIDLTAPYSFTWNSAGEDAGSHTLELRAYDLDGRRAAVTRSVVVQPSSGGSGDIVVRAVDVGAAAITGDWALTPDSTAADGVKLRNPNRKAAKLTGSVPPVSYFDVTFEAEAATPYHLWLRMRADGDDYANDSVFVWIDGAATGRSVILEEGSGGVRGWGWSDEAYGGLAAPITFSTGGTHTLRVGVREDGVSIDQIVLSPGTYLTTRPGAIKDDATIVGR